MRLTRLGVRRFRNIERADILFSDRITVLNGENAQGKTNVIEALGVLGSLKSFRTRRISDFIMEGSNKADVEGEVWGAGITTSMQVCIDKNGKSARLDGRNPSNAQEYLSILQTVLFTPFDLELSLGNQELRRAFVDRAAFFKCGMHISWIRRYEKLIRHRNTLLRDSRSNLSVWNEQLALVGSFIRKARQDVLLELQRFIDAVHSEVSGRSEKVDIAWEGRCFQQELSAENFLKDLEENEEVDRRTGHTTIGPHRDRISVHLCGRDTRAHASRGQHRTVALSLKLAVLTWASETVGERPLFVLDDPGSELDKERLSFFGSFLSQWPGQVIIACTPEANLVFETGVRPLYYRVRAGVVQPVC